MGTEKKSVLEHLQDKWQLKRDAGKHNERVHLALAGDLFVPLPLYLS